MLSTRTAGALIASALALALPAAAGAADAPPFSAGFLPWPLAPAVGQTVLLTATSTGGSAEFPITHAWDLDGDGAYDDAVGDVASVSFATAGAHTVGLEARRAIDGTFQIQTASAVLQVGAATTPSGGGVAPSTNPGPAPEAAPESAPASDPAPNQAPIANFDAQCTGSGFTRRCTYDKTREGDVKRISAAPSSDPDGQIVRYEWSLDGDDVFEVDGGATPYVDHVFHPSTRILGPNGRIRRVSVRVTDDRGATATRSFVMQILAPSCQDAVTVGSGWVATADCLRPYQRNGVVRYLSSGPVDLNGITLEPTGGQAIVIDVPKPGAGGSATVGSKRANVSMAADGIPARFSSGEFQWTFAGAQLNGVQIANGATLNGMRIAGLDGPVKLSNGRAQARVHMRLPETFGAPTSSEPVVFGGVVAKAAAAGNKLRFAVPSAALGPIGLDELVVAFDGEDLWTINAAVVLPPPAAVRIAGEAGIRSTGAFDHASAELAWQNGGLPLGGPIPVFLQRIKFTIEMNPKESDCVPMTGVKPVPWPEFLGPRPASMPATVDYGHPTFAMCGEIGLTGGPSVGGKAAVRLDAGLGWATYADRPWVLRAHGDLSLVEIPLASARFAVYGDGYITLGGEFHWGIANIVSLSGGLNAEVFGSRFNASAHVDACLDFADMCAGARAIISSKGIAACLKIDVLVTDWTPGLGMVWGKVPNLYFQGCDIGDYKVQINRGRARAAAAGAPRDVRVAADLPGTVLVFEGAGAPPKIDLVGPGGERIASAPDARNARGPGWFLVEDPRTNLTHVVIERPTGGVWKADTADGSARIVEVQSAEGLEPARVEATVRRAGDQQVLRYDVAPRKGQKVTFVERGETAGQEIGIAQGARGTLRFTPSDGAAERRRIVAVVEQDGQPRAEIEVATFAARRATAPARVRGLRVKRRGAALVAQWRGAQRTGYQVRVAMAGGRTVVRNVARPTFRVRGVGRGTAARVTVRAISASGMVGKPVTVKVPARHRR